MSIPKKFGSRVTRTQLVRQIAPWCGSTVAQTNLIVETFLEQARDCLERGQTVEIQGFGVFEVGVRPPAERFLRNAHIVLPERGYIKFRPARDMVKIVRELTTTPSAIEKQIAYQQGEDIDEED